MLAGVTLAVARFVLWGCRDLTRDLIALSTPPKKMQGVPGSIPTVGVFFAVRNAVFLEDEQLR